MFRMENKVITFIALCFLLPLVFSCCIPDQWQGQQGIAIGQIKDGKPSSVEALFNVSFDAKARKVFVAGNVNVDGKSIDQIVLQDYSAGKQYIVIAGHCTVSNTAAFPATCTRPNAKQILSSNIGVGNTMQVDVYNDVYPDRTVDITVQSTGCIPITTYQKTTDSLMFIQYMGITPGIANMSVFNIPKPCMHSSTFSQEIKHQTHIGKVFF